MRKKKLYVVGYDAEACRVLGKKFEDGKDEVCFPMTFHDANLRLKVLNTEINPCIYKLVKVDPKKI